MKELTIEEKAKAYDKVREKIKVRFGTNVAEEIFSEFEESEDEKIRKKIIALFKGQIPYTSKEDNEKFIAWLEKQGKKPVEEYNITGITSGHAKGKLKEIIKDIESEKVESKFKVGDWIVRDGKTLQISHIDKVLDGTFHYWFTVGTWLSSAKMEDAHLWTIQDAKDGDVLAVTMYPEGTWIGIFKEQKGCTFSSYCFVNAKGIFKRGTYGHGKEGIHPATKEQRDILFAKMKEAKYTFDFEKKELREIEQKPAWSEEDEEMFEYALDMIEWYSCINWDKSSLGSDWLKSLKQRIGG